MMSLRTTFQGTTSPATSKRRQRRPETTSRYASVFVESLESRQLLAATTLPAALWTPTATNLFDAQNGPMANFGADLVSIYKSYETSMVKASVAGSKSAAVNTSVSTALAPKFPTVEFSDGLVGMDINSIGGDFNTFVSQLSGLGMQVTASNATYGIAEGWVPVSELPTIARLPQTMSGSPILVPVTHSVPVTTFQGYQGTAYNEPETALQADAARSQYGLTGAGVTIGVLSDSVSQVGGGLADSYATGDLSASNPVKVIADGPAGSTDEGRAMLESIHDIAPGASLQFATAGPGDLGFMQNIEALYAAGSKVIVDDISYQDEPFFQDGLIAQGVDYVTARGDEYFSSAANSGSQQGYLSTFRPITATVGSGGSQMTGTFQNFNGGTGPSSALLQVTTGVNNAFINFQYDQPFKTQEPAGSTATTTSDMSFYVFNSSGTIVASGTDDNVATQQPYQAVTVPTPGTYYVAIKLVSGTAPGHVEFVGTQDQGALTVSQQYGAAGGTYYPSSEGHEVSANTIGVGATPWWAPTPFLGQSPLQNEASSSTGPGLIDLSPKGTPITPQIVQNPAITAPDGGTTSFFGQSGIDTTQFSPNTPYNFVPTGQQSLKNFFGTSQAAPNAAAVAALMLQEVPTLSRVQILQAMETTATPMNGTSAGSWNVQSGYGLVNALAAIKAIAPASSLATSTITVTPSILTPTVGVPFNISTTVAGAGSVPTGSVDFYDISDNTDLGPVNLSSGQATLSNTPTVAGAHVYLVTYSGNATYARSTAYLVIDVLAANATPTQAAVPVSQGTASQQLANAMVVGLTSIAASKNTSQAKTSTS